MNDSEAWDALDHELDAWAAAGLSAGLWWRDDDAGEDDPRLQPLIGLAERYGLVCGLAAVPMWVSDALARRVRATDVLCVMQHGYAHANHAPRGQGLGAWELGLHRPKETVLAELEEGRDRLRKAMGDRFLPVVVPPWNHIDPALYPDLAGLGFAGVSAGGDPPAPDQRHGLRFASVHVDPIKWKGGLYFKGAAKALGALVEDLAHRRAIGPDGVAAPTGLITHHKDSDADCWAFVDRLIDHTARHPAVTWLTPQEIFA